MNLFLSFSDGAKYALIAKNLILNKGYTTDFSFWGGNLFSTSGIPKLIPYSMLPFLKLFGVSDKAVIFSSLFFFLLLLIFVFLLTKKLFNKTIALLSTLAVLSNLNFWDYATSGASEVIFSFEIVLSFYLLSLRKKYATLLSFVVIVLMYFTRPQAFIYMGLLILYWLLIRFGIKKAFLYFFGLGLVSLIFDRFVIYPLSFKYPLTPVIYRGLQSILTYSSSSAVSDNLRGAASSTLTYKDVFKKVFYNLYNFYKALPAIANPYLWCLYIISLFKLRFNNKKLKDSKKKDKELVNYFNLTVFILVTATFLVTALTIPFYRYLHPVIPLVYIVSIATLVKIIAKYVKPKKELLVSFVLVLILVIGSTLGVVLLDSRYKAKTVNKGKPPVYALLSYKLKENTKPNEIVLTNLDTWGSWYGERKTVWFPLTVAQFVPQMNEFDAIYLTSYKMNDENYYMGDTWRQIFENPNDKTKWTCDGCGEVAKSFSLNQVFTISPEESYQKEEAKGVLLIRD